MFLKVYTVRQAASLINMEISTLRRYIRAKKINAIKYSERGTRIEENELIRFQHGITKQKTA